MPSSPPTSTPWCVSGSRRRRHTTTAPSTSTATTDASSGPWPKEGRRALSRPATSGRRCASPYGHGTSPPSPISPPRGTTRTPSTGTPRTCSSGASTPGRGERSSSQSRLPCSTAIPGRLFATPRAGGGTPGRSPPSTARARAETLLGSSACVRNGQDWRVAASNAAAAADHARMRPPEGLGTRAHRRRDHRRGAPSCWRGRCNPPEWLAPARVWFGSWSSRIQRRPRHGRRPTPSRG